MRKIKLIFVCSPYKGDIKNNTENAKRYCRFVYKQGSVPYAPHLHNPAFLDEHSIDEEEDLSGLSEVEQTEILSAVSGYKFDTEFVLNFIAALMATAMYPEKPDVTDLIIQVPPWWIADKTVISELMEFLSLFITDKRKNVATEQKERL